MYDTNNQKNGTHTQEFPIDFCAYVQKPIKYFSLLASKKEEKKYAHLYYLQSQKRMVCEERYFSFASSLEISVGRSVDTKQKCHDRVEILIICSSRVFRLMSVTFTNFLVTTSVFFYSRAMPHT